MCSVGTLSAMFLNVILPHDGADEHEQQAAATPPGKTLSDSTGHVELDMSKHARRETADAVSKDLKTAGQAPGDSISAPEPAVTAAGGPNNGGGDGVATGTSAPLAEAMTYNQTFEHPSGVSQRTSTL